VESGIETALSSTTVREVMSPGIVALSGETTVGACAQAMHARRTHAVLIIDAASREPLGWVFHRDVLLHIREDPLTTLASAAVSHEAVWIDPLDSVEEAAQRMQEEDLTHLLVGSPGTVAEGVLSSWDVVGFYANRVGARP
jgi:CBS domain-containing protein